MPTPQGSRDEVPTASYESQPTRRRLWVLIGLTGIAALAWWLVPRDDGSLARVHAAGGLRIGYAVQAPYVLVSPTTGEITGAAAETARLVAEQMGIGRIDWVQADLKDLLSGLAAHRYDVVAAGLYITPEQATRMRFSEPTLRVQPGWLVAHGNPKTMPTYAALANRTDLRVAVLQGSIEQARFSQMGLPAASVIAVPDSQVGQAAVLAGSVDGLALSLPAVRRLAAEAPGRLDAVAAVDPHNRADAPAYVAFAFHPRDAELQAAWNDAQGRVVGTARHLATLASFGFTADDLPGDVRTRDLLSP